MSIKSEFKVFSKAFTDLLLRFADGSALVVRGMNAAEPGKDHAITEGLDEEKVRAWLDAHADSDLVRNGHLGVHEGDEDGVETAEPPPPPASSNIPAPSTSDGSTGGANPPPKDAATKPADEVGKPDDAAKTEAKADQAKVDGVAKKIEKVLEK